ncbi:serine/threonine protein phosphatase PP2A-associated protein [Coprinopsis marcescibilis]|uniref:Serine/threonine protein phosphatase PP2A-associated protein n=1 Tax=Coprinopsis marcescibilis TaxID=230819 RepID=A0A5C3LAZ4_COPMA|nr:serine/threonine protein phosphatase PP2A-associated protein [Coprinopsis marcescibilis]
MSEAQLSLAESYSIALKNITKAINLPPGSDAAPELISESHRHLKRIHLLIVQNAVFSPNETVEDIATHDLVYLSLPYVLAEVQGRLRKEKRSERLESVEQAQQYMKSFITLLETYNVATAAERDLFSKKANDVKDPGKRREIKINQFKREKELKGRIETLGKRQSQKAGPHDSDSLLSDFDLIASLLPKPKEQNEEKELDPETDEILRETTLIVLRLLYTQAQGQAEMMERELDMLKLAPSSPRLEAQQMADDQRIKQREDVAAMWRLDAPPVTGGPDGKGPLLDSSGKVLRPFTILPSDAGERARLQSTVFGPAHNLPTMTVDEYLEIENEQGNIITGGGPASETKPTSSEELQMASEMDGSAEGELKEEQKRQKDENWAKFVDTNPRGAGNTMNRG